MSYPPTRAARQTSLRGLEFTDRGAGPAVVLVHGWCLNRDVWMYLETGLLASGHRVIAPDLAGFGTSSGVKPHTRLDEHGADVTALLRELGVTKATLVGFAFGAGVILSADDYTGVSALVSIAIPSAGTAPYGKMRASMQRDWPLFARRSAGAILSQPTSDESKAWLAGIFEATHLTSALAGLEILEDFEPTRLIQRWDAPAVFVHGGDDPIVPPSVSQQCADRFGGSYLEVEHCGHLVPIDQKEAVLEVVRAASSAAESETQSRSSHGRPG